MFSVVYIISRDMEEAGRIADVLVAERLVACVNFGIVSSVYRWEGRVQHDTEVSMICKTTTERVPDVIKERKRSTAMSCRASPRGSSRTATART